MDITEICAECRNYFAPENKKENRSFIHSGEFTIQSHSISPLSFINEGQFFRIVGSGANDGVYQNTTTGLSALTDETFKGAIWEMSVPRAFLEMCEEIAAWRTANESASSPNMSPFQSESFAGYSYSKGTSNGGSSSASWQTAYKSRLNAWRRLNIL